MFVAHERSSTADAGRVHKLTRHERRSYTPHDFWRDFVPLLVIGLGAWVLLAGTPSEKDLRAVEIKDRNAQRATAYRLCTRNKDDRAYGHARERGLAIKRRDGTWIPAVPMSAAERRRRRDFSRELMDTPLLPILNCNPNTGGFGARPLSIAQQESYMDKWRKRGLAPVEYGVCPKSTIGGPIFPDRC
jgi:hypothetical protein